MAKKNEKLFAAPDAQADGERAARDRASRRALCERLCANDDFREWIYAILDDFCAFEFGSRPLDEFTQGIRACADRICRSLLVGGNGVQFVCDLKKRHLEGVRRGLLRNEDNCR